MSADYTLPPLPLPASAAFAPQVQAYGHACAEHVRAPLLARIAELEAERDADRRREYGYSQETVDAISGERDRLRAEVEALRAGIEKAMSEIDDAGPKALKYARQELEAAIAARKGEGAEGA